MLISYMTPFPHVLIKFLSLSVERSSNIQQSTCQTLPVRQISEFVRFLDTTPCLYLDIGVEVSIGLGAILGISVVNKKETAQCEGYWNDLDETFSPSLFKCSFDAPLLDIVIENDITDINIRKEGDIHFEFWQLIKPK